MGLEIHLNLEDSLYAAFAWFKII